MSAALTTTRVVVAVSIAAVIVAAGLAVVARRAVTAVGPPPPSPPAVIGADVAVYGGTASGAIAAVSAARSGQSVVLVSAGKQVGGMVSGGLGWTDIGRKELVGGLTLDFHRRVGRHYGSELFGAFVSWYHEPHVAEAIFRQMLAEAGVSVLEEAALDRSAPLEMTGDRIAAFRTTKGTRVEARAFIDASYEGDLLAEAGVPYTVGREGTSTYHESLAGIRPVTVAIEPLERVYGRYYANDQTLPGVSETAGGPVGSDDLRVQPYNFRLCVTSDPDLRVPFVRPAGYDAGDFVLVERAIETWTNRTGEAPRLTSLITLSTLPGGKADLNTAGLFSTDLVGGGDSWAEADDEERARIWRKHHTWQAGFLYFLRTDPAVPVALRTAVDQWGLCADEFVDTGNWPTQLYVREARRMVGATVLTQHDIQVTSRKPESIGVGSYRIDAHFVQRVLDPEGFVRGEGHLDAPTQPYDIPYAIIIPPPGAATNLVVSVAVSASHVAWSSLRMEPNFMAMGDAAGAVAALASERDISVQAVPYDDVAPVLLSRGGLLTVDP